MISDGSEVTRMDLIARLIEQLASDDEVVRVQAGELLLQMGTAAVRPLVDALQNPRHPARPMIAATLGQLGDRRAVEPLIAALQDPDKAVRFHAALALAKLKDRRAVRPLIRALFDEMPPLEPDPLTGELLTVRAAAAQALGELRATEAIPALRVLLTDENYPTRQAAVLALLRIGTPEAVQAVAEALLREHGPMPWELVLRRLARIPSLEAQMALERLSHHPNPQVQALAKHLLAERNAAMTPPAPEDRPDPPPSGSPPAMCSLSRWLSRWSTKLAVGGLLLIAVAALWQWSRWAAATIAVACSLVAVHHRRRTTKPPTVSAPPPLLSSSSWRDETR